MIPVNDRVTMVVITHDRKNELLRTLAENHKALYPERMRLTVVDNASRDGSAAAVRRWFPHVQVIEARANLGATAELAATVPRDATSAAAFAAVLAGLPWVVRARRPVPPRVEAMIRAMDEPRRTSRARRYVG